MTKVPFKMRGFPKMAGVSPMQKNGKFKEFFEKIPTTKFLKKAISQLKKGETYQGRNIIEDLKNLISTKTIMEEEAEKLIKKKYNIPEEQEEAASTSDSLLSISNFKEAKLYQDYANQRYEEEYNKWSSNIASGEGSSNEPPPIKPLTLSQTLKKEDNITWFNAEGWNEDGTAR